VLREATIWIFPTCPLRAAAFASIVFRKETGIGAAFRSIPTSMPSDGPARAAADREEAVRLPPGHDLVTGSTGTERPPPWPQLIDYLNSTRSLNIISLEDPIEFVHRSKISQVIQRELGTHLPSFPKAYARRCAKTRT